MSLQDDLRTLDLGNLICERIMSHPEKVALVWKGNSFRYGDLGELLDIVSEQFDLVGLTNDDVAMIILEKSPIAIASVLALLRRRTRFVICSPQLNSANLGHVQNETSASVSITIDQGRLVVKRIATSRPFVPSNDAYLMLTTSGSTGTPKIVPLSNRAVLDFSIWAKGHFEISETTVSFNYAPLNFDLCFLDLWTVLSAGGTVLLVTTEDAVRPNRMVQLVSRYGVTLIQAVPLCFQLLGTIQQQFENVTTVAFTGDVLPKGALERLRLQFPCAALFNIYGCTETNDSFVHRVTEHDTEKMPIGTPIVGVDYCVIDSHGAIVAGNGVGELYVHTPFQADGYLDADRDVGRFVDDPTEGRTSQRWFRTGDLVERDSAGMLLLRGRTDFQVKIRGVAVNTSEVERSLRSYPGIRDACAVCLSDDLGGKRIAALVVSELPVSVVSLKSHCARELPQAAIPSEIRVLSEDFPRTSTGKPDRQLIESSLVRGVFQAVLTNQQPRPE